MPYLGIMGKKCAIPCRVGHSSGSYLIEPASHFCSVTFSSGIAHCKMAFPSELSRLLCGNACKQISFSSRSFSLEKKIVCFKANI